MLGTGMKTWILAVTRIIPLLIDSYEKLGDDNIPIV
jgi:hypothetical protein